jgi:uncharacterized protein (DUF885 family)
MDAEGWALYAEDLVAEPKDGSLHGFYSAAEHVNELRGQLWRAARVRIDVGLHTERMNFSEAVNYFSEHVLFYPQACQKADGGDDDARAVCDRAQRKIFRDSKWPTQAITNNLGKKCHLRAKRRLPGSARGRVLSEGVPRQADADGHDPSRLLQGHLSRRVAAITLTIGK